MEKLDPILYVLGLDPSTDVTGAALIRAVPGGVPLVVAWTAIEAKERHDNTLTARARRIAETRESLSRWMADQRAPDLVGYEAPFMRGYSASEAIPQATGAYLSLPDFLSVPHYGIQPSSAKAVYGGGRLARAQAKPAAIKWARAYFENPRLTAYLAGRKSDAEAVADALAVAISALKKWEEDRQAAVAKAAQKPLFGPGSGTSRGTRGKVVSHA